MPAVILQPDRRLLATACTLDSIQAEAQQLTVELVSGPGVPSGMEAEPTDMRILWGLKAERSGLQNRRHPAAAEGAASSPNAASAPPSAPPRHLCKCLATNNFAGWVVDRKNRCVPVRPVQRLPSREVARFPACDRDNFRDSPGRWRRAGKSLALLS